MFISITLIFNKLHPAGIEVTMVFLQPIKRQASALYFCLISNKIHVNITAVIKGTFLFALLFIICFFAYDQIFSPPKIHRGVVLEKLFIPEHTVAGPNSATYGNYRAYKYIVRAQRYHQWIAIVKADDGDTLKVHCTSGHFQQTVVGDTLLFKEYKGKIFGIDYLAHSEEDTVKSDLRVLK